jgi:multidrug efflux system outer membrane protein
MAPRYVRPTAPVPATAQSAEQASAAHIAELGWRDFFSDARLQALIGLALENNRDLRIAVLNVEQSRARYRIQRSELLPSVTANGTGVRQHTATALTQPGQAQTQSLYSVTADVTAFELDLWGRVRSLNSQALETYFASAEARRSAQLSLVAEVAMQYMAERAAAEQLVLARQTLETVQKSFGLTRQRYAAGAASELDVRTSESQFQTARANVAIYAQQQTLAENALVLLVGCPLPVDLPPAKALGVQALGAQLPAGVTSDVLQRRPDVLQAEHSLKAANANIGAARAAFFPTISLTASGGTSSRELSGLFDSGSGTWLFQPHVTLPIFAGGRNRANLQVANIGKRIEIAAYEKAVQTAFREVADALGSRPPLDEQIDALSSRVASERQRYELSERRYRTGIDSYVTVLLAQQDLYNAEQTLIQAQLSRLNNYITLYKALGGGLLERSASKSG